MSSDDESSLDILFSLSDGDKSKSSSKVSSFFNFPSHVDLTKSLLLYDNKLICLNNSFFNLLLKKAILISFIFFILSSIILRLSKVNFCL